jgi:hypothetical protein
MNCKPRVLNLTSGDINEITINLARFCSSLRFSTVLSRYCYLLLLLYAVVSNN